MPFHLTDVVPWGRTFDEYRAMFALTPEDLEGRILGCGDGPAAFNATATASGARVVSADPLYQFTPAQIRQRIEATAATVEAQTRANAHEFVWTAIPTVEALVDLRMTAMNAFLSDFDTCPGAGRYVGAALPDLPFARDSFDLALCSHFLFLYSALHDADFHVRAIIELGRVASDVRIFPLLELGAKPSRHIDAVVEALSASGLTASRVRVPYEFQRGGNEMLKVTRT
jgi:hypothetical protein